MVKLTIELFSKNPLKYVNSISNKKLTEYIMIFADNYYNNTNPNLIISDNDFDVLVDILKDRDPNSKYFTSIGAPIINDKVELPFPMFSLDKVKPNNMTTALKRPAMTSSLISWIKKFKGPYSLSDKLDGMSALLYNGHLYKRGQGLDGQDIGYLLNYINIGDVDLKTIGDVAVRGELIISKKNFKIINKDGEFKNARNAISGIVNRKNPNKNTASLIDFVVYNVIHPIMKQEEQYEFLKSKGFNVVYNKQVNKLNVEDLKELTFERKKNGEYEIDGIVIVDNKQSYHIRKNELEDTKQNPSYSVAFKFLNEENVYEVEVKDIEWNISRYNYLKPKVIFDEINISGSNVSRATAHNAKFVIDNKIGIGSIIKITKSGDVIPFIVSVIKSSKPLLPKCKYHWSENEVDFIIDDDNDESNIKQLLFEFKSNKIDEFGDKVVETLYDNGIDYIEDIIGKEDLLKKLFGPNQGHKMMMSFINNIEKSSIEMIMTGSGCFDRGIGIKIFELVNSNVFIDDWNKTSLININGIGEKKMKLLLEGKDKFKKYYSSLFKKCKENGINIVELKNKTINKTDDELVKTNNDKLIKTNDKQNSFKYSKVVFTGFRNTDIENFIKNNNGKVMNKVSGNTDLLICKDKTDKTMKSSNYQTAKSLNIDIMTMDEFIKSFMI